ncbi:MAG TPA: helix-turn-helix domain-containing protein [Terracidiphilus sp.]|jgi:excisionase family DNA binding protein
MSTATAKVRDLSETPATNMPSAKFPPVSENSRTLIHEIELAPVQEPPLRQVFEIGARRIDAGSQLDDRNSDRPNHDDERLLNARQVADKLGVSERFIRDHTTRRSSKIPAVKLGKLIRYRRADVDVFMAELGTLPPSRRPRFGV